MEHDRKQQDQEQDKDLVEASTTDSAQRAPADQAAGPGAQGDSVGRGGMQGAGAWEADGSLMSAMGLGTIYRDALSGAPDAPANAGPVDAALAQEGQGTPHESGATMHDDSTAHAAAAELGAAAFTAGSDIYFGAGQFNPGSEAGDQLIAHEVAHVKQSTGVARPKPGQYKVSSPNDAAEIAAREAERSGHGDVGSAPAGTIHRSLWDDAVNAVMKATGADKLEDFLKALAAHNVADAKTKWAKVNGAMRGTMRLSGAIMNVVGHYPSSLKADPIESVIDVMGKDGLPIMKDVGAAFDRVSYVDLILDGAGHDAAYWMPALKGAALFDPWLAKMPGRTALTESRLTKLDPWMTQASTVADARKIFEQAYPKLMDTSYLPTGLKVAKWDTGDIKRMWTALQGKLPLAHANTINGGFNLGTDEKLFTKDATGALIWSPLGFGWHDPGPAVIVMPKSSSNATGGGTVHDMTGGDVSGVAAAGTKADPKLSHWDGTMLHEIGHGVGSKTDGNTFAQKHGDWKGGMTWQTWSAKLFDDTAAAKALPTPPPKKVLSGADARQFMSTQISGGSFLPTGWKQPDVETFINTHYKAQLLTQYWNRVVKSRQPKYYAGADTQPGDKRNYVFLERGGLGFTSYKQEISDNKVSWYSISSTVEWFAEQYANYYRTGKSGAGADTDTKKKLDAIDKMEAGTGGALNAPASPGGGAAPGASPGGATDTGAKGGAPAPQADPNAAAAARIRRMNF